MDSCIIQWLNASHGAIWWIPHWDWVRSGEPSVVLSLAGQAQGPQGCKFINDNLSLLTLLNSMTTRGYRSSGIMRQTHLMWFKSQKDLMKLPPWNFWGSEPKEASCFDKHVKPHVCTSFVAICESPLANLILITYLPTTNKLDISRYRSVYP